MSAGSTDSVKSLSIAALQAALVAATADGGAWGGNMSTSKDVLLRVGGIYYTLADVATGFVDGSFCLILQGGEVR